MSQMKKHKNFDTKFKTRIVLEALKNEKTINQIAAENEISPKNIINWKKHFLENMNLIFEKDKTAFEYKEKLSKAENEKDDLYRKIGQLATENEWLKKKSVEYGLL